MGGSGLLEIKRSFSIAESLFLIKLLLLDLELFSYIVLQIYYIDLIQIVLL
jgi:hypothetical protein